MEVADWASLSDEQLLERRISKLGLRLDGTAMEPLIRLYDELSAKGMILRAIIEMRTGDLPAREQGLT